jgi:hypothetical protein
VHVELLPQLLQLFVLLLRFQLLRELPGEAGSCMAAVAAAAAAA